MFFNQLFILYVTTIHPSKDFPLVETFESLLVDIVATPPHVPTSSFKLQTIKIQEAMTRFVP